MLQKGAMYEFNKTGPLIVAYMQVLLDLSSQKGDSKEWKDYRQQLNSASKLKVSYTLHTFTVISFSCNFFANKFKFSGLNPILSSACMLKAR